MSGPLSRRDIDAVLDAAAGLWSQLDGTRLFVTGGTGFIGTWLLETFLAARERFGLDAHAVVLTRNADAFAAKSPHIANDAAIELLSGDVRSFAFPPGEFRFVIHAATEASAKLNNEQPREMFDSIVTGTRRVLDFAVAAGTTRFLFTSSGAVYGRQPHDVDHVPEEYAGAPEITDARSAYGEGKRAAEALCAMYAADHPALQIAIARCFAFVGPHLPLDRHFAIGNFIGDALAARPIEIRGDGTPLRSYLYAADLAIWLWMILFRGASMRPYNVGSEDSLSVLDTAQRVAAAVTPPPEVHVARRADPQRPAERYVPSTKRARTELTLEQSVGLDDAIARTIAWYRGGILEPWRRR